MMLSPASNAFARPLARLLALLAACAEIVDMELLEPILGVFRKLVSSILHDHHGFAVLNVLFAVLTPGPSARV